MLAARDMGDARIRAASVLQHFEQFSKQHAKVCEVVGGNTADFTLSHKLYIQSQK